MVKTVVNLKKNNDKLTLKSFSNIENLENKIYYESYLGLSLQKRKKLFEIIEKDNSWSNRQEGLYYTNLYAHNTDWFMHKENNEFNELTDMVENHLMYSVLKVPLKHKVKECWGGIYGKDDYAKVHHHSPYLWAFTYYPFAPEGSSPLIFYAKVHHHSPYLGGIEQVYPSDDLLLLFPANTYHSVPKSKIEQKRVVVAGNINIEKI